MRYIVRIKTGMRFREAEVYDDRALALRIAQALEFGARLGHTGEMVQVLEETVGPRSTTINKVIYPTEAWERQMRMLGV